MKGGTTDILVIGSGIAGLSYALKAARHFPGKKIHMLTKGEPPESNTRHAQGGVAAVLDRIEDSFEQHVADTLAAGDGWCDREVVELVVREGPDRIRELLDLGAAFDREVDGRPALGREGGHSVARIVHTKDHTGLEIHNALLKAVRKCPNIELRGGHFAVDLLLDERGRCAGVEMLDTAGRAMEVHAGLTVLATGGAGQVYEVTTNPLVATGDGIAMASRAGAEMGDMAFVQFHPTALYEPGANPPFLISEAVRGIGAELRNEAGAAFMHRYDARGSLATRDVVARAIFNEMRRAREHSGRGKYVYLDLRHLDLPTLAGAFPTIHAKCTLMGLDLRRDMVPVVPAAHYLCGGVRTDHHGSTSIPRLMCIGESACTGLHGANRLASNSLLEALVFAHRAFEFTAAHAGGAPPSMPLIRQASPAQGLPPDRKRIVQYRQRLRTLMTSEVGIVRTKARLRKALQEITALQEELPFAMDRPLLELRNLLEVARLTTVDSLRHTVSRGGLCLAPDEGPGENIGPKNQFLPAT